MQAALTYLATSPDFGQSALQFFESLGYSSPKTFDYEPLSFEEYVEALGIEDTVNTARAMGEMWERAHLLFQFTTDELGIQKTIFDTKADKTLFEAFVFVALELKPKGEDKTYSRTDLAGIARELNKPFASPVIVLFKHGQTVTLASVGRRENKVVAGEAVLQKVSLLKDIRLPQPIAAHERILQELVGVKQAPATGPSS